MPSFQVPVEAERLAVVVGETTAAMVDAGAAEVDWSALLRAERKLVAKIAAWYADVRGALRFALPVSPPDAQVVLLHACSGPTPEQVRSWVALLGAFPDLLARVRAASDVPGWDGPVWYAHAQAHAAALADHHAARQRLDIERRQAVGVKRQRLAALRARSRRVVHAWGLGARLSEGRLPPPYLPGDDED